MADTPKILGQLSPIAAVLSDLYAVPSSMMSTISTLSVCNRGTIPASFRISVAGSNAPDNVAQYLYYDLDITEKDTFMTTIGVTLGTADVVRCLSSNGSLSFNLFGIESSP
jgi:hypothetical protein